VAAAGLHAGAADVRATVRWLTRGASAGTPSQLNRVAALFDHAYVQFRSEPAGDPGPDWLVVLSVVHRLADYAAVLQARHPGGSCPPPDAAAALETAADAVAAAYADAADAVATGGSPTAGAGPALGRRLDEAGAPAVSGEREAALRIVDGWGWLHSLADDLDRLERAFVTAPVAAPSAGRR
jgi:hypothetical protein